MIFRADLTIQGTGRDVASTAGRIQGIVGETVEIIQGHALSDKIADSAVKATHVDVGTLVHGRGHVPHRTRGTWFSVGTAPARYCVVGRLLQRRRVVSSGRDAQLCQEERCAAGIDRDRTQGDVGSVAFGRAVCEQLQPVVDDGCSDAGDGRGVDGSSQAGHGVVGDAGYCDSDPVDDQHVTHCEVAGHGIGSLHRGPRCFPCIGAHYHPGVAGVLVVNRIVGIGSDHGIVTDAADADRRCAGSELCRVSEHQGILYRESAGTGIPLEYAPAGLAGIEPIGIIIGLARGTDQAGCERGQVHVGTLYIAAIGNAQHRERGQKSVFVELVTIDGSTIGGLVEERIAKKLS